MKPILLLDSIRSVHFSVYLKATRLEPSQLLVICTCMAQEGNVPQIHGVEALSSFHQDTQDPRENPAHFQNLDGRVGWSHFQAQESLAAHSSQIGRGPPHHFLNLPDFRRGLATSHEHPMESIGSGRWGHY